VSVTIKVGKELASSRSVEIAISIIDETITVIIDFIAAFGRTGVDGFVVIIAIRATIYTVAIGIQRHVGRISVITVVTATGYGSVSITIGIGAIDSIAVLVYAITEDIGCGGANIAILIVTITIRLFNAIVIDIYWFLL
jgi:uncharacterized membrane protein